jgi:hypothetical protein
VTAPSARTSDSGACAPPSARCSSGPRCAPDPAAGRGRAGSACAAGALAPYAPSGRHVDPGADQPTTQWLPHRIRSGRRQRRLDPQLKRRQLELRPFRNRTQHLGAGPVGVGGALWWTLGAGGGVLGDGYLSTLSPVAACSRTARRALGLPRAPGARPDRAAPDRRRGPRRGAGLSTLELQVTTPRPSMARAGPEERARLVRRAQLLARVGLGWHGIEAAIAIGAGAVAGLDSADRLRRGQPG